MDKKVLKQEVAAPMPEYVKVLIAIGVILFAFGTTFLIITWIRMKRAEKMLKYEVEIGAIQGINITEASSNA